MVDNDIVVFVNDALNANVFGVPVHTVSEAAWLAYFAVRALVLACKAARHSWHWLMGTIDEGTAPVKPAPVVHTSEVTEPKITPPNYHYPKDAGKLPELLPEPLKEAAPLHLDEPDEDQDPMSYAGEQAMIALTQSDFAYDEASHTLTSGGIVVRFSDSTSIASVVEIRVRKLGDGPAPPALKDLLTEGEYTLVCAHATDLKAEAQRLDLLRRNREAGAEIRRARLEAREGRRAERADVAAKFNTTRRGPVPTILPMKTGK